VDKKKKKIWISKDMKLDFLVF